MWIKYLQKGEKPVLHLICRCVRYSRCLGKSAHCDVTKARYRVLTPLTETEAQLELTQEEAANSGLNTLLYDLTSESSDG